jgi:hypothetical protein
MMRCFGCQRELEVGDNYIKDTASGFLDKPSSDADSIIGDLFGGVGGQIVFCEDCTTNGGRYMLNTVYGDEDDD